MCLSGYVRQEQCFWDEDAVDPGMDSSFPREFVFPLLGHHSHIGRACLMMIRRCLPRARRAVLIAKLQFGRAQETRSIEGGRKKPYFVVTVTARDISGFQAMNQSLA